VKGILFACLLASIQSMSAAQAFEADIHYSTTYALARAVGWPEADAVTIASANQGVDENQNTVAALEVDSISNSLHQAEKNLRFHCFSEARGQEGQISADVHKVIADHFSEVPVGVAGPRKSASRLIALGTALHCQQDAEAHVDFGGSCGSHSGSCLGHTYETFLDQVVFGLLKKHYFNPDHPGVSGGRLLKTLQGTVSELAAHRPKAFSIPSGELTKLSNALRGSGLDLPDDVRLECNRYIAGKWLLEFLHSGSATRNGFDTLEKLSPTVAATCRNSSLASAIVVRIPAPRYPRLKPDASPYLVAADGTYQLLDGRGFDAFEARASRVQVSHWRQLVALPVMAQVAALTSADANHDFARRAPAIDDVKRVAGALQAVDRRDVRTQLARLEQREQRREVGSMQSGLASHMRAPEHTDDGATLEQRQVQRDRRDAAAREADDEIAAVPAHRTNNLLGSVGAHRVVGDVEAAIAGKFEDLRFN